MIEMGSYQWFIPIEVEFVACKIKRLSFSQRALTLQYEIGTAEMRKPIPQLNQSPDCGYEITNFAITHISSARLSSA